MKTIIHRGANEIGGTAIEVQSGRSRLILDMGIPLKYNGDKYNHNHYKHLAPTELIALKILPDIKGIYPHDHENKPVDGVIISHPHQDHYGFFGYLKPEIPIYLGEATKKLMDITVMFTDLQDRPGDYRHFKSGKTFTCATFKITPYLMDHSGFDAYAFLIEDENSKIIYTGDFRGHGRKRNAFKYFLEKAPRHVDELIMEGTMIGGRAEEEIAGEQDLEEKAVEAMKQANGITLIYSSSQNIDRLVTFYRAALQAGKTLIVDLYTAIIMDTVKDYGKLPYPSKDYKKLKVFYPPYICNKLEANNRKDLIYKFAKSKISKEEIAAQKDHIAMLIRPSHLKFIDSITDTGGGLFIYSLWEGYLREESGIKLLDYIKEKNLRFIHIHTSGHAGIKDLKKTVETLKPRKITPVHTEHPENYKKLSSRTTDPDQAEDKITGLINETLKNIETHHAQKIALNEIPLTDPETFALFKNREVEGIIRLECSERKMEMAHFPINSLEDLTLYLGSLMIHWLPKEVSGPAILEDIWDIIYRRDNPDAVEYPHPTQEEILKETSGYIIFREDLITIAAQAADLTIPEADRLIKSISNGDPEEIYKEKKLFTAKARSRSLPQKEAEAIFETLTKAAPNVTCKASTANEALLIYRLLYLKAHYPIEFNTALLTQTKGPEINTDPDD